ncbi:MAG: hypothetical protein M3Z05_01535 [Gemmatimonadota bacterium]|nr:hypothetical protein [Gemmatimonadota bacterium]
MLISHVTLTRLLTRASGFAVALFLLVVIPSRAAEAQARERPVAFDSAGRVMTITPPLAARLGLSAPLWPVSGDYIDARLYSVDVAGALFVLVVQRQREVLERYPLDLPQRRALAAAIDSATSFAAARGGPDAMPTIISEPVRGTFVVNQTLLGALVFGPAASALAEDATFGTAAYLAVTGGMFFFSANMTQTSPVSRAQNHLSWHSARRGAIAADLLLYTLTGDDRGGRTYAAATLAGGIAGDVLGFMLGKPMTDAEAHGTSHGSTVTAVLTASTLGSAGLFKDHSSNQLATAAIVGAGAIGYPLGLHYVRTAPYRVTAGDVGTLVTTEFLGMGVAATLLSDGTDDKLTWALIGTGFTVGAIAGERLLVRPFDHTESDARLLQYGSFAGALVGLIVPVVAQNGNTHLVFGAATAGGILGAILTEQFIKPAEANRGLGAAGGKVREVGRSGAVDVKFTPESMVFAKLGVHGQHPILALSF